MPKVHVSVKRIQIDKSSTQIVGVAAGAAFVIVFCIFAARALIQQAGYQSKIIQGDETAVTQLKKDIKSTNNLVSSYQAFVSTPQNLIGGNPQGNGSQDGDNAKIVLDALPSKYDFPALTTSLEKILTSQKLKIQSISGTDDQAEQADKTSATPEVVPMPFQLSVAGNYKNIQKLIDTFHHSIRPFQIQTMQLSGSQQHMTLTMTAQTFYQPEKIFNVTKEPVKP
jgi:Tfp pilus assembly protein PilO